MSEQEYIDKVLAPGQVQLCFHIPCEKKEMPNVPKKSQADVLNQNRALGNLTLNFMKLCANNLVEAITQYETKFLSSNVVANSHGLFCDFCSEEIIGSRYECSACEDYNLCHSCFDLSDAIHGNDHDFIVRKNFSRINKEQE